MNKVFMRAKDIHRKVCAGMRDDWTGYAVNGTNVECDAGYAILFDTSDNTWKTFAVEAAILPLQIANPAIPVTGINRVYVSVTAGVATFGVDTVTPVALNLETSAPIATYLYDATGIQVQGFTDFCENVAAKTAISISSKNDGIFFINNPTTVLTTNASDHVIIEQLLAFRGPEFLPIDAFNSSTANMYIYYWDGTTWVKETPATATFERTQYQGAAGLSAVTVNQWTVNYVFKSLFLTAESNPNETFIILGQDSYVNETLAEADTTNLFPLGLPEEIGYNAVLVGKIIAQNAASAAIVKGHYFAKPQFTD